MGASWLQEEETEVNKRSRRMFSVIMTPVSQSAAANRKAALPGTSFHTRSWSRQLGTPSWAPRWSCSHSSASSARRDPSAGCHSRSPDGDEDKKSTLLPGGFCTLKVCAYKLLYSGHCRSIDWRLSSARPRLVVHDWFQIFTWFTAAAKHHHLPGHI